MCSARKLFSPFIFYPQITRHGFWRDALVSDNMSRTPFTSPSWSVTTAAPCWAVQAHWLCTCAAAMTTAWWCPATQRPMSSLSAWAEGHSLRSLHASSSCLVNPWLLEKGQALQLWPGVLLVNQRWRMHTHMHTHIYVYVYIIRRHTHTERAKSSTRWPDGIVSCIWLQTLWCRNEGKLWPANISARCQSARVSNITRLSWKRYARRKSWELWLGTDCFLILSSFWSCALTGNRNSKPYSISSSDSRYSHLHTFSLRHYIKMMPVLL